MKMIPFFILTGFALSAFSQSENPAKPKGQNHLSFQKGKSEFILSGNYRLRGEIQHNYNVKLYGTSTNEEFLLSRLRINLEYHFADRLVFVAQIQDARVAGSSFTDADFEYKNNPYHDPFDINNLYVAYKPIDNLEIIIGRQSLNLANRRLFGPGDWGNTGRYIWDIVNVNFTNKYFISQAFYGYNIIHEPDVFPNIHQEAGYTIASFNTIKNLPFFLDVFYVLKNDKQLKYTGEDGSVGNFTSNYLGMQLQKSFHNWYWLFLYAYQFGHVATDRISAQGVTTQVSYTYHTNWKPHIIFTYIYCSGDKNPDDGKKQTFDGIFSGSDTDLYSWMNFTYWKNIQQVRADLILNPTIRMSFRSEYHVYFLASNKDAWYSPGKALRIDKQGQSGSFIGQEADFTYSYKFTNWLNFLGGYCFFFPGEFIENTGVSQMASWAFGQLTFNF